MKTVTATLHDGSTIKAEIYGEGPVVFLPLNPMPARGQEAEEKQKWGVDPSLGRTFIDGLKSSFTVIACDYEGHMLNHPKPDTLTPENITRDILAIVDAAGADQFAYYGYSWLAVCGMQLGIRTDRLWALIMGGYPPIDGPYKDMLIVTKATHEIVAKPKPAATKPKTPKTDEFDWDSVEITMTEPQTRQFVTFYEALQNFDDRAAQTKLTCPRLCFAGSNDKIVYSNRWNNAVVDIAGPLIKRSTEIKRLGWDVRILEGLDHTSAMQPANVLPVIRPWLVARAS